MKHLVQGAYQVGRPLVVDKVVRFTVLGLWGTAKECRNFER